jgi:hypothetical protein
MLRIQHQHLRATTTIAASRTATGLFAANGLVPERAGGPSTWPGTLPAKRSYGRFHGVKGRGMQGVTHSVDSLCGE